MASVLADQVCNLCDSLKQQTQSQRQQQPKPKAQRQRQQQPKTRFGSCDCTGAGQLRTNACVNSRPVCLGDERNCVCRNPYTAQFGCDNEVGAFCDKDRKLNAGNAGLGYTHDPFFMGRGTGGTPQQRSQRTSEPSVDAPYFVGRGWPM